MLTKGDCGREEKQKITEEKRGYKWRLLYSDTLTLRAFTLFFFIGEGMRKIRVSSTLNPPWSGVQDTFFFFLVTHVSF
jgi:hypothetical protein